MKSKRIRPWRRLVEVLQPLVILGLPFLKIGGESALRFDVPTLQLHFFGATLWMEEFFIVLVSVIFLTFLFLLITLVLGRIWCGWFCPQTVLVDFTRYMDRRPRWSGGKVLIYVPTLAVSVLVAANLIWYFVSPYEFFPRLVEGRLGSVLWGFWGVLTVILFLNLSFLRHRFCSTVCPYSMMQSALYDSNTLLIAYDRDREEECGQCRACIAVCPVGIDLREGLNRACLNCTECIDACAERMEKKEKTSLIGYRFGLQGRGLNLFRPNVLVVTAATTAFLLLFLFLVVTRSPVGMSVLPNVQVPPQQTAGGVTVNSYLVSLRNRGSRDLTVRLQASAPRGNVDFSPRTLLRIPRGGMIRVPAYVAIRNLTGDLPLTISVVTKDQTVEVRKQVNFRQAEKK